MQTFTANKDIIVTVPLVDGDGNSLSVSAVSYRVLDESNATIIDWTVLAAFVAESSEIEITVPAASNVTPTGQPRALRLVEIQATQEGNIVPLDTAYVIQDGSVLQAGVNSFQTLVQADFDAELIPNIPGWQAATSAAKTAALIEARLHVCMLNFDPIMGNRLWGQDSLNFVPEGSWVTPYVSQGASWVWGGNLTFLSAAQFNSLPPMMLADLKRAQILEANHILGGDAAEDKRAMGIQLDTVGESKVMFRSGKPLQLPVCRRAAQTLGMWTTYRMRIGRR